MKRNWDDGTYKRWRKAVLARDGYKCRWPKCKCKYRLQCHHIKSWAKFPLLRYIISNGITLCKSHHDKIRKKEHLYEEIFKTILKLDYRN